MSNHKNYPDITHIMRYGSYLTDSFSSFCQRIGYFIYHGVFYLTPIWAFLAITICAPAVASYLACELLIGILVFLSVSFYLTPSRNLISDLIRYLRTAISFVTLNKKDAWLAEHGVKNLREYYEQLKKDGGTNAGKLGFDEWCRQRKKEPSYKTWVNWHFEQEVFCDPNITLTDTVVNSTSHYGEPMQAHVFHLKNNNPDHKGHGHKHLVMFVGRMMSAECRLEEMVDFAKKTGMHIHMVNYPGVNDALGRAYTEKDLQKCGRAVVDMLLSKSQHFPEGIPAKNISLYGNCLGSVVAELTYQDLLASSTPVARRILSNGYGCYTAGIMDVIYHTIRHSIPHITGPIHPTLHNLIYYSLLILLSPINLLIWCAIAIVPYSGLGWGFSPRDTAQGQDHDCLILGRADDGVLNNHRLIDYLHANQPLEVMQKRCDHLAHSVLSQHHHYQDLLQSILTSENTTLAVLVHEINCNKTLNTETAFTESPTSHPETLVKLLKNKGYDIDRAFAEYIALRASNLLDEKGRLCDKHTLLNYTRALHKQTQEQELAFTETTKNNAQRMLSIMREPHFADLHDLAVRDPTTGQVGTHDHGKALYQKIADTTLADTIHAQKCIKRAWQCHLFTKKLTHSPVMTAIKKNRNHLH